MPYPVALAEPIQQSRSVSDGRSGYPGDAHGLGSTRCGNNPWMAANLADSLAALAQKFVEGAGGWREYFDYSLASGAAIDRFVELLLSTGDPISELMQMGMGAYVGEVIRRNVGGEWMAIPQGPTPDDPGIMLNGLAVLPFEKVRKRIALGPTNSVEFFVQELAGSASLPAADREARWSRFRRRDT